MIYLVYCNDQDSSSGVAITGIFESYELAANFANSEGPDYQVLPTTFGPIDWDKLNPLPPIDWTL